jgi:drug/metabolite transporter (DMT)-like permease
MIIGLGLCLCGAAALVGSSMQFASGHLFGDLCGLATSLFFGGYFIAVRSARRRSESGKITFLSSLITAALLLVVALVAEDRLFPASLAGVATLVALSLVSHAGGQGLLTYALGHLPAAFSALVILLEACAAAALAWAIFDERLTPLQGLGAALILVGIAIARPRSRPAAPA